MSKRIALSERGPTAFASWSAVCIPHGIQTVLPVTKPLNVVDEVKTSCPGGGGGFGALDNPGRPTHPHRTRRMPLRDKNESYQRVWG